MILPLLLAMLAGWINRHQQQVISYLQEENCVLKAQLHGRRLCLTNSERHRLAVLAHPLDRTRLQEVSAIATPDTLLRWYHRLIAQKFDASKRRRPLGRPRLGEEIERLVVRMAEENPTWGYRRIQGAWANLGHHIDTITMRNILRRHHLEPTPQRRKAGMSWGQFLKLHEEQPRRDNDPTGCAGSPCQLMPGHFDVDSLGNMDRSGLLQAREKLGFV